MATTTPVLIKANTTVKEWTMKVPISMVVTMEVPILEEMENKAVVERAQMGLMKVAASHRVVPGVVTKTLVIVAAARKTSMRIMEPEKMVSIRGIRERVRVAGKKEKTPNDQAAFVLVMRGRWMPLRNLVVKSDALVMKGRWMPLRNLVVSGDALATKRMQPVTPTITKGRTSLTLFKLSLRHPALGKNKIAMRTSMMTTKQTRISMSFIVDGQRLWKTMTPRISDLSSIRITPMLWSPRSIGVLLAEGSMSVHIKCTHLHAASRTLSKANVITGKCTQTLPLEEIPSPVLLRPRSGTS